MLWDVPVVGPVDRVMAELFFHAEQNVHTGIWHAAWHGYAVENGVSGKKIVVSYVVGVM